MQTVRYGIIGRGKWGANIVPILKELSKPVDVFEMSRPALQENKIKYEAALKEFLFQKAKNVDVIWLAVPPGDQYILVKCALENNKHVIVEKPWMCNDSDTKFLIKIAEQKNLKIGVHYQYCFLDEISDICTAIGKSNNDLRFSGTFTTSGKNRLSIPAIYNLGCHLLAIKALFFPNAAIGRITTAYNDVDRRTIKLYISQKDYVIDFLNNTQPLIQRYIQAFEKSIFEKKEFQLDLNLSLKINYEINQLNNQKEFI